MKTTRGELGFDIPVQIPDKESHVEMTPEAIEVWISQLRMADIGKTAKELYLTLSEANQIEMTADVRFKILELLKPTLQLACQALKKHYIIEASILNEKKIAIANFAQTLQLEMAYGYKLVIEENNKKKANGKDILPISIYSTMEHLTSILFRCYQLYSAAPKELWRELHLLYKYSDQKNLLKYKINDASNNNLTLMTTYKHAILLAATNPFQWRQNEQEIINNALDVWAPYASLSPYSKDHDKKPSLYIIHTDQDLPPNPLGLNDITPSKSSVILDLNKEVEHLKEILKEMSQNEVSARIAHEGDPEFAVAIPTLNKLLKTWQPYITKKYTRYKVAGKMQLVFGLYAIHYYFNNEKSFDPNACDISQKNTDDAASGNELPTFEVFEDESDSTSSDNTKKEASKEFPIYVSTMVDVSPTGACLIIDEHSFPPVQSGEIITMRPEHSPEKTYWNVGVVSWLKHADNNNLKVGIQILAPHGKAAAAQILNNDEAVGSFLRCLLLPEMKDLDAPSTVITPIVPFKEGKSVNLYIEESGKVVKATLTKEINASGSYRQFEYESEEEINLSASNDDSTPLTTDANNTADPIGIDTSTETKEEEDKDKGKGKDDSFSILDDL